jgi:hypothetical protein
MSWKSSSAAVGYRTIMEKYGRLDRKTRTGYGWWGEPWHAKNQGERDKELRSQPGPSRFLWIVGYVSVVPPLSVSLLANAWPSNVVC